MKINATSLQPLVKSLSFLTLAMKFSLAVTFFTTFLGSFSFAAPEDLEYFKQFLYQHNIDTSDPDFPQHEYRWLMSQYGYRIPLDEEHEMEPNISLFLLGDGAYKIVYNEYIFEKKDPTRFVPGTCKVIEGRWDVPDKNLELGPLAFGERVMVHDQHGVLLKFKENINRPGLKEAALPMSLGFGNYDISQARCFFPSVLN